MFKPQHTINNYDTSNSPTTTTPTPTTHQQQLLNQQQLRQCTTTTNVICNVVPKYREKPSPDIEWLKHSSGHKPWPLWTTRCSRTWVLPLWTTRRSRAKPSPLWTTRCSRAKPSRFYAYAMNSTCVYQHTTQLQHQHLCLNIYDTLPNWTTRVNNIHNEHQQHSIYIYIYSHMQSKFIHMILHPFIAFIFINKVNEFNQHFRLLQKFAQDRDMILVNRDTISQC